MKIDFVIERSFGHPQRENVLGENSRGYQMIKIKKRETIVFELHDQWIV